MKNKVRHLLNNIHREVSGRPEIDRQDFLHKFYPKQRSIIIDSWRYACVFGGKRSGKSSVLAGLTFYVDNWVLVDSPGVIFLASTTAQHAKTLFLKRLQSICKAYDVSGWNYQLSKNRIETGSNVIIFVGLKDLKSVYDQQGVPVKLCVIDEAQFVRDEVISSFIDLVVSIGMIDFHPESKCVFAGNPFPVHSGYVWDQLNSNQVRQYRLNLMDNVFYSEDKRKEFIESELKKRGESELDMSNNTRRLLFGEFVEDTDKLVLSFKEGDYYNKLSDEVKDRSDIICGVDLGFNDKTAICVIFYDAYTGNVYLDYEFQEAGMTILPLSEHLKKNVLRKYDTNGYNVIDTQGGGKQTAESLSMDYGIPFEASKKSDKMHYVSLLRGFNKGGRLKIKKGSVLANESKHILYGRHHKSLDDDHFHSDIFHAVLYAFRFVYDFRIEKDDRAKSGEKEEETLEDYGLRREKEIHEILEKKEKEAMQEVRRNNYFV